MTRLLVAQSGGCTAVINSTLVGVVDAARTQDGIDARSINNTDILQEIGGMVDFQNALIALMLPTLLSIAYNGNLMRSRNDAFL